MGCYIRLTWPNHFTLPVLRSKDTEPVINLDVEIVRVEAVNHFRYQGSEVMSSGRLDEELRTGLGAPPKHSDSFSRYGGAKLK